jgi:hypothetical protein
MPQLVLDTDGKPRLLAASVEIPVRSGNPNREVGSGKFGEGANVKSEGDKGPVRESLQGQQHPLSSIPANVEPESWHRRMDTVRDLARRTDLPDQEAAEKFLRDRLKREIDPEELDAFLLDVRMQQLNDLVDAIDQRIRIEDSDAKRPYRAVQVTPPRGWLEKNIGNLADGERASVAQRLIARGHDESKLSERLKSKVEASNQTGWEPFVASVPAPEKSPEERAAELALQIAAAIPAPIVNLEPHFIVQRNGKVVKTPVRDEKGLIVSVTEEEVEDGGVD